MDREVPDMLKPPGKCLIQHCLKLLSRHWASGNQGTHPRTDSRFTQASSLRSCGPDHCPILPAPKAWAMPNDLEFKGTELQRSWGAPRDYAEVGFGVHFRQVTLRVRADLARTERQGRAGLRGPLGLLTRPGKGGRAETGKHDSTYGRMAG